MAVPFCQANDGGSKTAELNRKTPKPAGLHRGPLGGKRIYCERMRKNSVVFVNGSDALFRLVVSTAFQE